MQWYFCIIDSVLVEKYNLNSSQPNYEKFDSMFQEFERQKVIFQEGIITY